jgi:pyruvate ferredoxin oxidoreductase alpha subunit
MRKLLTGNSAAAWGARLAEVDYLPVFPITPQTEIIETLAEWVDRGELDARLTTLESEHSMVTAAGAAAATGVRVFTATSSQGLLYAMEMLYNLAGWRTPLVLVNVSRGLSAPITLEPDHNDVLAARDSGFLQLHCATCQEVLDSVLLGYRLSEDMRVRLPVLVNLDGFYLSFTREPVIIPTQEQVRAFLPPFDPGRNRFRGGEPVSQAVAVLGGGAYSYFRYQAHLAALAAKDVFDEISADFGTHFGRAFDVIETYRCEDAEILFVMMGSFATKAREAVDRLRADGQRVGLLRPRLLRPFPSQAFVRLLSGRAGVAVIDQNLSTGLGGILYTELAAALYQVQRRPVLVSYVGGLGGRDITAGEFYAMVEEVREAVTTGRVPPPRLLFTEPEMQAVRDLQRIAGGKGRTHE